MAEISRKRNLFKDKAHWITTWSRFKAGDRFAFEEIYSEYIDSLFAYGSKMTNNREIVKDSIHDLFIDIFRYKIDLQKPESLEFYLFKALKRLIHKKLIKNRKFKSIEETEFISFDITFDLEDNYIQNETEQINLQVLTKALNELSENCRELLFYKFKSNLTYIEIGQLVGVKPDTVKKQVYSIISGLRENFRTKLPDLFLLTAMCLIT